MTTLGLTAVMQMALLATGTETYADAHKATTETGRPMVVMVGADWCAACQHMKQDVLPQVRSRGVLRKVAFAMVNLDQERELGSQLTRGGPIPQLLMYRRTKEGWRLRRLIGGQSPETVSEFINEGLQSDEAGQQADNKTSEPKAEAAPLSQPAPDAQASPSPQAMSGSHS